jgi:hypothetical protein
MLEPLDEERLFFFFFVFDLAKYSCVVVVFEVDVPTTDSVVIIVDNISLFHRRRSPLSIAITTDDVGRRIDGTRKPSQHHNKTVLACRDVNLARNPTTIQPMVNIIDIGLVVVLTDILIVSQRLFLYSTIP